MSETDSITYVSGDITRNRAELLVNTVNTVGVMGKGVALAFKTAWGDAVMRPYRQACQSGALRPGGCLLFPLPDGRRWAALATKADWRHPSQISWVETGLRELARLARQANIHTIALPPPGCGNGGLAWEDVHPLVLRELQGFSLHIYARRP